MNYPVWDVPVIGGGWVIGIIAIIHVMISHFAIGGGFYLPLAEARALRHGRDDWMQVLRGHAKFFLVLTAAFGTTTGAAIWFAIGLANPEATSTLIHYFVFGWAIEWTFFTIEITAAAVYYYTWGRVPGKLHLAVGWVYAASAWMSLVIINGILCFMLAPGQTWLNAVGTGTEASVFFWAFFNPTYFPSLVLRTLICISLAGLWAFLTASRIDGYAQPQLKTEVMRWSLLWLVPSFVLMPFAFVWYLLTVPDTQLGLLQLGISTIGMGTFTQVTRMALVTVITSATIAIIAYFFAWREPRDFKIGHAICLLCLALAATAATEYSREMLRKPYVVGRHMYSNGVRVSRVKDYNENGYLKESPWVRPAERAAWAGPGNAEQLARGELMFRGQCMACHTVNGYRPIKRLLAGRNRESIGQLLETLHQQGQDSPYFAYMPPLVGQPGEIAALGDYLATFTAKPKSEDAVVEEAQAANAN